MSGTAAVAVLYCCDELRAAVAIRSWLEFRVPAVATDIHAAMCILQLWGPLYDTDFQMCSSTGKQGALFSVEYNLSGPQVFTQRF